MSKRVLCAKCRRRPAEGNGIYCAECKIARRFAKPKTTDSQERQDKQEHYSWDWRKLRNQVLKDAGIPSCLWPMYDVHHEPEYNPEIEPDHSKYRLIPLYNTDHKRHTVSRQIRDKYGRFTK